MHQVTRELARMDPNYWKQAHSRVRRRVTLSCEDVLTRGIGNQREGLPTSHLPGLGDRCLNSGLGQLLLRCLNSGIGQLLLRCLNSGIHALAMPSPSRAIPRHPAPSLRLPGRKEVDSRDESPAGTFVEKPRQQLKASHTTFLLFLAIHRATRGGCLRIYQREVSNTKFWYHLQAAASMNFKQLLTDDAAISVTNGRGTSPTRKRGDTYPSWRIR